MLNFVRISSVGIILLVFVILVVFFSFVPVGLWITAFFSGVRIKISDLVGMKLRRVRPSRIVNPMIKATKAGLDLEIAGLEAHYLAGGNVNTLVDALIAAQRANIKDILKISAKKIKIVINFFIFLSPTFKVFLPLYKKINIIIYIFTIRNKSV